METLEFQDIRFKIIDGPLQPVPMQALTTVEDTLGLRFPEPYRAFVTTLGLGETELSIRTLPPKSIPDRRQQLRERLSRYWFWDGSPDLLTQAHAVECVPFFDSSNGDDILFHPEDRDRWFILPHEKESACMVTSFQALCDYYSRQSPRLKPPYKFFPFGDGF